MATEDDFFGSQLLQQYQPIGQPPAPVHGGSSLGEHVGNALANTQNQANYATANGNVPQDLRPLRDQIGALLMPLMQQGNTPYGGNMNNSADFGQANNFLSQAGGATVSPNIISQLMSLSGAGLDPAAMTALRNAMGAGLNPGVSDTLTGLMQNGGAPDITAALDAIRAKGLLDIEEMSANQRERFGTYGLGRGSDVEGYVARGASRGVADINAAQSTLAAQILSQATGNKLSAANSLGSLGLQATGQQASIAQILASLQQGQQAQQGQMLSAAGGLQNQAAGVYGNLAGTSAQIAGMGADIKGQNLAMQYADFIRMQQLPPGLQAALGYATSFPPNKPVVPEQQGTDWGAVAGGIGSSLIGILPYLGIMSDRNMKTDIAPVAAKDVLARLDALPIFRWKYKGDATPHLGPMAQDFQAAFGVGDGRTINLVDVVGVMLASQKGLAEKIVGRGKTAGARRAY